MRCYECGGVYDEANGDLQFPDETIGDYVVRDVKYKICRQCNKILLTDETWEAADIEYERVKNELISKLPIGEFIVASEAYNIMNITRQAFHQNRRIKNGFIHSVLVGSVKMYHKKSVKLFADSGDGRFPLVIQPNDMEKEYVIIFPQLDIAPDSDDKVCEDIEDDTNWGLINNSTPGQWYDTEKETSN